MYVLDWLEVCVCVMYALDWLEVCVCTSCMH